MQSGTTAIPIPVATRLTVVAGCDVCWAMAGSGVQPAFPQCSFQQAGTALLQHQLHPRPGLPAGLQHLRDGRVEAGRGGEADPQPPDLAASRLSRRRRGFLGPVQQIARLLQEQVPCLIQREAAADAIEEP